MRTFPARIPWIVMGLCAWMALPGCASLRSVDPSLLSHPAMDLRKPLAQERSTYLSPLGAGPAQLKSAGACTTCAH